jgi:hypothetical protein
MILPSVKSEKKLIEHPEYTGYTYNPKDRIPLTISLFRPVKISTLFKLLPPL